MQYLLVDSRQRFLGTLTCEASLHVGDVFQNENSHSYAVVGLNQSRQRSPRTPSLTVVRINPKSQQSPNRVVGKLEV